MATEAGKGTQYEQPLSNDELEQITKNACDNTLAAATSYIHSETEAWNSSIINLILKGVVRPSEADESTYPQPSYKFAVNSTIIQHLSDPATSTSASTGTTTEDGADSSQSTSASKLNGSANSYGANGSASSAPARGRRGMHSATGAFWNNNTDGMWSFKWEGGDKKGMDVVVSVIWVHAGPGVIED